MVVYQEHGNVCWIVNPIIEFENDRLRETYGEGKVKISNLTTYLNTHINNYLLFLLFQFIFKCIHLHGNIL